MLGIELAPEEPLGEVAALGAAAEAEGFDAALVSCHYNNRDPMLAAQRVAEETATIRVGPAAANPYETHPVKLAGSVATLAEAASGRTLCGLAPGDRSTLSNLGIEQDRPLRRVLETMRVARQLWAGERVSHDGTFVARDAGLNFDAEAVPVYVGAQGPDMLRMAAKHADGALVNASHPRDVSWAVDRIAEGNAERPAERGDFETVAYAVTSVAEDGDAARAEARFPVAFVAAGAADPVLDRHDVDREAAARVAAAVEAGEFRTAAERVTPAMLEAFCVAGTPAEVADGLSALLRDVDGLVAGWPLGPDPAAAIRLLGEALDPVRPER
ncbi:MAG: 5,10-methylenetetrahydromethanopterin reductase [Halobacteriaceae archaeon]